MRSGTWHPVVDPAVMEWLVDTTPDVVVFLLVWITHLGSIAVILPILILACFWDFQKAGVWVAAVFIYWGVMSTIKTANPATRPDLEPGLDPGWFPGNLQVVYTEAVDLGTTSFPSGHAMLAALLATLVVVDVQRGTRRQRLLVAGSSAVLIGYSRVALGVHYPIDVVGGMILGVGLAGVIIAVRERVADELQLLLALAVVITFISVWVRSGGLSSPTWAGIQGSSRLPAFGGALGALAYWQSRKRITLDDLQPFVGRQTLLGLFGVIIPLLYVLQYVETHPLVTIGLAAVLFAAVFAVGHYLSEDSSEIAQ